MSVKEKKWYDCTLQIDLKNHWITASFSKRSCKGTTICLICHGCGNPFTLRILNLPKVRTTNVPFGLGIAICGRGKLLAPTRFLLISIIFFENFKNNLSHSAQIMHLNYDFVVIFLHFYYFNENTFLLYNWIYEKNAQHNYNFIV